MASEDLLRGLLAGGPDALFAIDAAGRILFASRQAERMFGWTADELIGRDVELLVPARFHAGHVALRRSFLGQPADRPMGSGQQLWAQRRDGSQFPADISLSRFDTAQGQIVAAAVRDATDRVELEAQRHRREVDAQHEQTQRLESLGQLAGGVAHDFNNLLGVILNYCTLLERHVIDEPAASDLGEIKAAAQRAAALTRQLLAFARRDTNHPEPLDLNSIVAQFCPLLQRTLGERIDVRLHLAPEPTMVLADRFQIELVLLNLALNARDAMPGDGVVTIATRVAHGDIPGAADTVLLDVSDTGTGMEPEALARAFEPFFTTKPVGEGTGLGLATVFGIVRQSGGHITLASQPGVGTTVSIVLPAIEQVAPTLSTPHLAPVGGSEHILLVEDEPALRVATARLLSEHGYTVMAARDGLEALHLFDRLDHPIDLVVTDVAMPRLRGDQLAQQLIDRQPDLRFLFMSGYDSSEAGLPGRLLEKPVDEALLIRTIREVLDA